MSKTLFILLSILMGFSLQAQICSLPTARAELNIGNVRAGLLNGGDFWWNGIDQARYEVPKIEPGSGITTPSVVFAGGIWLTARDNNNDLKSAIMTFRNEGTGYQYEFYPGPISNTTGSTSYNTCEVFDRFFEIRKTEIQYHISLTSNGLTIPIGQIASNVLEWPAKGNTHFTAFDIEDDLAPFHDYNQNGIYDPENGDYPKVIGDQTFFWVMNDLGGFHTNVGGEALKVEVQFLAHAFTNPTLLNTTIYECKVINKSFGNLHDFHFGLFSDPEIGSGFDNKIGCDTLRNMGYAYKETSLMANTPMIGNVFLNQEMTAFSVFSNTSSVLFNEVTANNRLHGLRDIGIPYCFQGLVAQNCIQSKYMFPGNPNELSEISMCSGSAFAADYRTLQSSGPLSLDAWEAQTISWATHVTFPSNYDGCPDIAVDMGAEADLVLNEFNILKASLDNLTTGITNNKQLNEQIFIFPNPANDAFEISIKAEEILSIELINVEGRTLRSLNDVGSRTTIELQNLPSGIYLVQVKTKVGLGFKKVLKK